MAAARPLDSGVGSAAGAALRSADLPGGSRPAWADVPGGRWPGPGDVAPSYLQDRQDPVDDIRSRGARQRRCAGDRRELGFNLHPQLREDGERHLEVRIGNVETESGGRQVFGAAAKANTDIGALIRRALEAVGRTGN